jgi:hypothetical protein
MCNRMDARCNALLRRVNHDMQKHCQAQSTYAKGAVTFSRKNC